MKKILIPILLALFCAGSAFCGEFEDTLKKAEQGDAKAQYSIGLMYNNGQGVTQDFKQAFYWFKKSAEQGFANAQGDLGVMYDKGKGVIQNYKQAFNWYKKSAEQGYASAQYNVGLMYYQGTGITQNFKNAYIWESLAAAQSYKNAAKNRDITAKQFTPQQLVEAQALAAQMQEKIDSSKR